jgi:hypothetical protein
VGAKRLEDRVASILQRVERELDDAGGWPGWAGRRGVRLLLCRAGCRHVPALLACMLTHGQCSGEWRRAAACWLTAVLHCLLGAG